MPCLPVSAEPSTPCVVRRGLSAFSGTGTSHRAHCHPSYYCIPHMQTHADMRLEWNGRQFDGKAISDSPP